MGTLRRVNEAFSATASLAATSSAVVPKTILVVDDRSDDVELLTLMLRRARVRNRVEAVHSMTDGIAYLSGQGIYADRDRYAAPTLLLLDLHLPDGSGLDILRWIRSHRDCAPVGVVVLTGSHIGQIRECYDLGAHSFLVKPLKFSDFQNMIDHVRGVKVACTSEGYLMDVE